MKYLFAVILGVVVAGCVDVDDPAIGTTGSEIVGGEGVDPPAFPWVAQIWNERTLYFDYVMCTGSVIAPQWVLSAAHCAGDADYVKVNGERVAIDNKIVHPDYDWPRNDVVLFHLTKPVDAEPVALNLDPGVPTEIPLREANETNANVLALGWGLTSEGGSIWDDVLGGVPVDKLQKVELAGITRESCQEIYTNDDIQPSDLCAGLAEAGKGICGGDSGGPLITYGVAGPVLVGITQGAIGCGREMSPDVFVRVSSQAGWIAQELPSVKRASPTALISAIL